MERSKCSGGKRELRSGSSRSRGYDTRTNTAPYDWLCYLSVDVHFLARPTLAKQDANFHNQRSLKDRKYHIPRPCEQEDGRKFKTCDQHLRALGVRAHEKDAAPAPAPVSLLVLLHGTRGA